MKFDLKSSMNHLEDAIITISGPALAISGIIAGVDLVTGGHAMQNVPWLTLAWAICLLLTLDFQVLALGARSHKVYLGSHKSTRRKVVEIILACLVAAAISYVSIQMQSIIARVNSANITIDHAAAQMGINTIALIWERSALVLVLIFLSGWFREDDSGTAVPTPQIATPAPVPAVVDLAAILDQLDERYSRRMEAIVEQVVTRVQVSITQETPAIHMSPAPALPEHAESSPANDNTIYEDEEHEAQPIYLDRFESKEHAIASIFAQKPGATAQEIAQEANCSVRTADKWMKQLSEKGGANHRATIE